MYRPRPVRGLQGRGDLPGDLQGVVEGDGAARDEVGDGRTLDQLQDERPRSRRVFDAVDLRDVRVVQRGEDPGLPLEARAPVGVGGERVGQYLQRHVAV